MIRAKGLPASAALLALLASIALVAGAAEPPRRSVTLDDMNQIKWPNEPWPSPDDKQIAYEVDGRIDVVPARGGEPRGVTSAGSTAITRLHFKEDAEDGYLTGDRAEHLYVYDLKTQALRQITSGDYTESEAAGSPDGRSVVFTSNREAEPDESYKTDLWTVAADNADRGHTLRRLTNDEDWNVPVLNAELFYQSLKKRGVDTELVVYPGTHHGGWSDEFERDRLVRIEQWFDKYLQAAPAQAAP
jgi:dipeptidyl aminopeptidase/acylaminoacyl peptidase